MRQPQALASFFRYRMAAGYVYILKNPSMPGLLKIGGTERTAEERARELYTTGVAARFLVVLSLKVQSWEDAEREVHVRLEKYRANDSREFFKLSVEQAVVVVLEVAKRYASTDGGTQTAHGHPGAPGVAKSPRPICVACGGQMDEMVIFCETCGKTNPVLPYLPPALILTPGLVGLGLTYVGYYESVVAAWMCWCTSIPLALLGLLLTLMVAAKLLMARAARSRYSAKLAKAIQNSPRMVTAENPKVVSVSSLPAVDPGYSAPTTITPEKEKSGPLPSLVTNPVATQSRKKNVEIREKWAGSFGYYYSAKPEVITNPKDLAAAWGEWKLAGDVPTVDFARYFIVAVYSFNYEVDIVAELSDDGNLDALAVKLPDRKSLGGIRFALGVISREGVRTVNKKALPS